MLIIMETAVNVISVNQFNFKQFSCNIAQCCILVARSRGSRSIRGLISSDKTIRTLIKEFFDKIAKLKHFRLVSCLTQTLECQSALLFVP